MTKRENEIYRNGFFAGRNSVKSKLNYSEEDIEEIRDYTIDCVDCAIRVYSEFFERSYKLSERLKKIPFLKNIYLKHKWGKKYYRIIILDFEPSLFRRYIRRDFLANVYYLLSNK